MIRRNDGRAHTHPPRQTRSFSQMGVPQSFIRKVNNRNDGSKSDSRIDGPEVAFYATHFFLENFMPEPCFKFALTRRGGRDAHRFLAASQKNLESSNQYGSGFRR